MPETVAAPPKSALIQHLEAMSLQERAAQSRLVIDKILDRCKRDGWFWLTTFGKTKDEAAESGDSVKLFPNLPQYRAIWEAWADPNESIYAVAKSRQILLSWLACAFGLWTARFHANRLVAWQSKREQDAVEMVSFGQERHDDGRMEFMEKNLPPWMQDRCRFRSGELIWPNGSRVVAIPEGGHQVRSKTPSLIIMDEMAFQEQARLAVTAILPTIQKQTKLIAISTPNGKANAFFQLYAGTTEQ